jgi:hypothetical protein
VPVKGPAKCDWPDCTESAWQEILSLLPAEQASRVAIFRECLRHPTRSAPTLDVVPIRNDPARWRSNIPGFRGLLRVNHSRPVIEEIEPRTGSTYVRFGGYSASCERRLGGAEIAGSHSKCVFV